MRGSSKERGREQRQPLWPPWGPKNLRQSLTVPPIRGGPRGQSQNGGSIKNPPPPRHDRIFLLLIFPLASSPSWGTD